MRVVEHDLPGVLTFHPDVHRDERGYFTRTWDRGVAAAAGLPEFVQDSQSRSLQGVVRGLHVRAGAGEGKLVRCARGRVWDVVLDLRRSSPAFGQWRGFDLDDVDHVSLFVPRGCAHGWQAISEQADVCYRIDAEHDPSEDLTIAFDDPRAGVPWPAPVTLVSERDRQGATFEAVAAALG
jgi:dTDP-4-dehydrorhamnose 3,5-epimerase